MAWSWSHTQQAYQNAQRNLETLDRRTRETIAAEWVASRVDDDGQHHFEVDRYEDALATAAGWRDEFLTDFIWDAMSEHAICDNGGFMAWACPYGCGPHLISFDRDDEESDDD